MNFYEIALEKLGWLEITLWYRTVDGYSFNHLEMGHSDRSEPLARSPEQRKAWSGGRWSKRIWFAKRGVPIVVLT